MTDPTRSVPDMIGAKTVQRAWDRSPLLASVKAARAFAQADAAEVQKLAAALAALDSEVAS